MMFISKDAQFYDRSYCIPDFFFVRFLVYELWSNLYLTVVNSALGPDSDANQFKLGSSLLEKNC